MRFGIVFFLRYLMELLLVEIYYKAVYAPLETEISSPSRSEVGFRTYARFTGKKVGECVEEALPMSRSASSPETASIIVR